MIRNLLDKMGMLKWLWLTLMFVIIDQISKQWAEQTLSKYNPVEIMPHINFYLAHNTGAAFSFLSDHEDWPRILFTIIALLVSVALIYWIKTLKSHERASAIGLALILSGAMGNVIDRILFGYVIDFIQFFYQANSCLPGFSFHSLRQTGQCIWPAFNVADSAISVGATMLIYLAVKEAIQDWKAKREKEDVED